MLVLCGFILRGQNIVTLNLTDNGKTLNYGILVACNYRTRVFNLLGVLFAYRAVVFNGLFPLFFAGVGNIVAFVPFFAVFFRHKLHLRRISFSQKCSLMYILMYYII